jgi:hypothetical protein
MSGAPSYGAYNETNNGRPHSVGINGYNTAAPMSFGTQANPWQEYFGGFDMPLPVLMFTLLNFSFRSAGQPVGELKLNPYDAFARENLALPDAYKGSSPYMTSIIINSAYNNSYCTLRRSADAMHFFIYQWCRTRTCGPRRLHCRIVLLSPKWKLSGMNCAFRVPFHFFQRVR